MFFFLYLQLVLERASVLVEKIRKQINPCKLLKVSVRPYSRCALRERVTPYEPGRRMRSTDSLSWLVSDGLCDAESKTVRI